MHQKDVLSVLSHAAACFVGVLWTLVCAFSYFEGGDRIYSSQMVRFWFGYPRFAKPMWSGLYECILSVPSNADVDEYVWTYVSPTFQMVQEDTLQTFQLPKPTACFGSILQIELMGRVQREEIDGLYYICICHVHVTGRPLSDFKFEGIDKKGKIVLKHLRQKERPISSTQTPVGSNLAWTDAYFFIERIRSNIIPLRNGTIVEMLLQYLLDAGLLKEEESEDD